MSTVNIQNATHIGGDPQVFLIVYDSRNVFLESRANSPSHWSLKRFRDKEAQEVIDVKSGETLKDSKGNIRTRDQLSTVMVKRPPIGRMKPASYYWRECPRDLYVAVQRGTWQHTYIPGKNITKDAQGQPWFEEGMEVFEMKPQRIRIGRDLARVEDLIQELERRLEQGQPAKRVQQVSENNPPVQGQPAKRSDPTVGALSDEDIFPKRDAK